MVYYTCEHNLEAMFTCIYEAWSSKLGHKNVYLLLEPVEQQTLFDTYIHVDADPDKAKKVIDAIHLKLSARFYQTMVYTAMGYEADALDNIYRCMLLGFAYGPQILNTIQYKDIMRNQQICTRVEKEINRFQEILRFHQIKNNTMEQTDSVYVAHFEPKSKIAVALGPIFEDRMPSEYWMIIDDVHREAVIHPKDAHFYIVSLGEEEFERLKETEKVNDQMTNLWRIYFHKIAIEERKNEKLQRNMYPLWTRKHAVEFGSVSL